MRRSLFLLAALTLFLAATPGWAHSSLEKSEPKSGAVLPQSPNELKIWFTEPIKIGLSTIEVRDEAGKQVDQHDLRADAKEKSVAVLNLTKNLGRGSYKVSWTAVAQDMHVSKGVFTFRVAP